MRTCNCCRALASYNFDASILYALYLPLSIVPNVVVRFHQLYIFIHEGVLFVLAFLINLGVGSKQ